MFVCLFVCLTLTKKSFPRLVQQCNAYAALGQNVQNVKMINKQFSPGPHIMRIHFSARFEKKIFNIHLVRIYSTSANEKNYILKLSLAAH